VPVETVKRKKKSQKPKAKSQKQKSFYETQK
jgi:hypothetical protein